MVYLKTGIGPPYEISMVYKKLKSGPLYVLLSTYGLIFFNILVLGMDLLSNKRQGKKIPDNLDTYLLWNYTA